MYGVHNCLNIAVGGSHVLGDVGVLESIYGTGALAANGTWWLTSAVLPIVTGLASFAWTRYRHHHRESDDVPHDLDWVKGQCKSEQSVLNAVFGLLACQMCIGVVFLHLVSICTWKEPAGSWIGLYALVPLFLLVPYVVFGILLVRSHWRSGGWGVTIAKACRALFCWCRTYQIDPESPNIQEPYTPPPEWEAQQTNEFDFELE
jgi:hypothetical protein